MSLDKGQLMGDPPPFFNETGIVSSALANDLAPRNQSDDAARNISAARGSPCSLTRAG